MDYDRICFVIMPYGTKSVAGVEIDFDAIYDEIFEPAINAVALPAPEAGTLQATRTDRDFFAGDIGHEMFNYLEYSRFALVDITSLNPNVFYELGHRHRAREAGTAIFRQTDAPIPFDINQIKAFPYEYAPEDQAKASRELIQRVLEESLKRNRPDSPIRRALKSQRDRARAPGRVNDHAEDRIREAENALRHEDSETAMRKYRDAVQADPSNQLTRMNLGLLLKNRGDWAEALEQFDAAIDLAPDYAEAHREKGIAENKLFRKGEEFPSGEDSLRRAIELNPDDFDALASLGGVLKRADEHAGALDAYRRSAEVSRGHSYPLLNAIKLEALRTGKLEIDAKTKLRLRKAGRSRKAQAAHIPPYDAPWSHFDLAEILLLSGDPAGFLHWLEEGVSFSEHPWQPETFRSSLSLLVDAGVQIPGLTEGIAKLDELIPLLD